MGIELPWFNSALEFTLLQKAEEETQPKMMDQVKSGGTLLNQRFLPSVLAGEKGIAGMVDLIRTYFKLGGHH